ncbi:MAG: hypothetical protein Q8R92_04060, partial [Deltaproteobacteria bacterium]|nr:hypothetical protein [Deltaproteobacteria bacterium]
MAERSAAGRPLTGLLFLALLGIAWGSPRAVAAPAPPAEAAPADSAHNVQASPDGAPRVTLLLLPSIQAAGASELSPWGSAADAPRFALLEKGLAARLGDAGFSVITTAEAIAKPGTRRILWEASVPLTP